jgi:catechol 2,3-dioxygenase
VSQSPTDHILSKATYLHDPNGILLEVTLETPERCRSVEIGPHGVVMIDSDGRHRAGTEPLDLSAAVAPLAGDDPWLPLARDSYVGHVHLHVPDLAAAHDFYRDVIGFQEHAYMTPIGMADLSAGGRFGHRMAVNNWHGPSAVQPPAGTAGMRFYELLLRDPGELDSLVQRAANAGVDLTDGSEQAGAGSGTVSLVDPAGNRLTVGELGL